MFFVFILQNPFEKIIESNNLILKLNKVDQFSRCKIPLDNDSDNNNTCSKISTKLVNSSPSTDNPKFISAKRLYASKILALKNLKEKLNQVKC